jgi:hypothetical protein
MAEGLTPRQVIFYYLEAVCTARREILCCSKHVMSDSSTVLYRVPSFTTIFTDRHHAGSDSVLPDALQQDLNAECGESRRTLRFSCAKPSKLSHSAYKKFSIYRAVRACYMPLALVTSPTEIYVRHGSFHLTPNLRDGRAVICRALRRREMYRLMSLSLQEMKSLIMKTPIRHRMEGMGGFVVLLC